MDARMEHDVAAAGIQLRRAARRTQPPATVGREASRRSRLALRVSRMPAATPRPEPPAPDTWTLPSAGRAGMIGLLFTEAAFFAIFVTAYLFYVGKSVAGPTPAQVLQLHLPILATVLLLSSSVTIGFAVRALRAGAGERFRLWW